ncbi:hypothetical protein B7494_g2152 [Chlorociboria aeruginascens]|nr:hypothetical protein B7494_g2152 [Chlorociboria aeruginascens]
MLANNDHPATHYNRTIIPQSTASLPFELETFLDDNSSRNNAFYALSNVFRHAAFSEIQVLNLIEFQIDREIGVIRPKEHRSYILNNLQFFKSILTRYIRCIKDTLRSLKETDEIFCSGGDKTKTSTIAEGLTADFERLLADTLELSARCTESIGVMINREIIVESRKAIEQSERIKKLTMLAAFFVPLSFTTSLFGMNFQEFGQGHLSVWLFAIVSIPMVIISFACYMWDVWAGFKYMLLWIWLNSTGRGR